MQIVLKSGREIMIRLLQNTDTQKLFNYLSSLSAETKSRFGPHPFDLETVEYICNNPDDVMRYVAVDNATNNIIAYMLFKRGMIEWDEKRYRERNQHYDSNTTVTYAPSVDDSWQSSGLGSLMYQQMEQELKSKHIQHIILWGGVQANNERAVNFYKKFGYQLMGSF